MKNKIITGFAMMLLLLTLFVPFRISSNGAGCFSIQNMNISSLSICAEEKGGEAVTDADNPKSDDQALLIKVMFVVLVIWGGISLYLFLQDRKILKLERELDEL